MTHWNDIEAKVKLGSRKLDKFLAMDLVNFLHGLHWWLHPTVLKEARTGLPDGGALAKVCDHPFDPLPAETGGCWIVYANQDVKTFSGLRDALLLPLRWEAESTTEQPSHSAKLPPRLHSLADQVIAGVYDHHHRQRKWRLELILPGDRFNLSDFDWPSESGGAALAAGLLAAIHGGRSNPKVWASARWNSGDLAPVGELDKKLALADAWGCEKFYVAHDQKPHAYTPVGPLVVDHLKKPTDDLDPRYYRSQAERSLGPMLEHFQVRPKLDPDGVERCTDWYLGLENPIEANDYYYGYLLEETARHCRDKLIARTAADALSRARLVTILSTSLVSLLVAQIVQPLDCLVFCTEPEEDPEPGSDEAWLQEHFKRLAGWFEEKRHWKKNRELVIERFDKREDFDHVKATFAEHIKTFRKRHPGTPLIFDVTSGSTRMKFALALLAQPEDSLLVIDHDELGPRKRPVPFTEVPHLFKFTHVTQLA